MMYTLNQPVKKKTHRLSMSALSIALATASAFVLTAVPVGAAGSNLLTNGGFESGAIAPATTDYTQVVATGHNTLGDPDAYAIGETPYDYHSAWTDFPAHDGDKMMIINASEDADQVVWGYDDISVTPGHTYKWEAYVRASYPDNPAQLAFSVNDVVITATNTTVTDTGGWITVSGTWVAPAGVTLADLKIVDTLHLFNGDDYALDDISFVDVGTSVGKATGGVKFMADGTEVQLEFNAKGDADSAKGVVNYKNSDGEQFMGKVTGYYQIGNQAYIVGEVTKSNVAGYDYFYVAAQDNGEGAGDLADQVLRVIARNTPYTPTATEATGSYEITNGNVQVH